MEARVKVEAASATADGASETMMKVEAAMVAAEGVSAARVKVERRSSQLTARRT